MTVRPNVLVFMTDQQRGDTIDAQSSLKALTPRMDEFLADATMFEEAYSPSPHCCPSRTSFFSSLYPSEHGVWNNVNVPNALSRGPREDVRMWSEDFAANGYRMAFTGKWHVTNTEGPSRYGWDELYPSTLWRGGPASEDTQRRRAIDDQLLALRSAVASDLSTQRQDGEILRPGWPEFTLYGTSEHPFDDDQVVARACEFIASAAERADPWVLYVGTLGPHDPYIPPQRFLDLYDEADIRLPNTFGDPLTDKPAMYARSRVPFDQLTESEHRSALHHYLAFCSYEDELFGRLIDELVATEQYDNTIILYVSDHGDYAGEHGLWTKGLPAFRGAYHVPLVIKATALAGTVDRVSTPVTLLDIGPTLRELCGITADSQESGRSLVGALREPGALERTPVFHQTNGNEVYGIQRTIVTDRWKLVVNLFDNDELYDLAADPDETRNLLHQPSPVRGVGRRPLVQIPSALRDVVKDLYRQLWEFALAHDDEIACPYIFTALATFGPIEGHDS